MDEIRRKLRQRKGDSGGALPAIVTKVNNLIKLVFIKIKIDANITTTGSAETARAAPVEAAGAKLALVLPLQVRLGADAGGDDVNHSHGDASATAGESVGAAKGTTGTATM